ncbi:MAG: DUF3047 domain-containing protein [Candidatus Sedimenticola endophacoides]
MRRSGPFKTGRLLAVAILMGVLPPVPAGPERIPVSEFASRGLEGWDEHSFQGHTRYRLVMIGDTRGLEAHSEASASALYRRIRVDLEQTPILRWRWRAGGTLGANDEQTREGADYAARIYLIKEGGCCPGGPWRSTMSGPAINRSAAAGTTPTAAAHA